MALPNIEARKTNINYKNKIVAFVDILGFSEHIHKSQKSDSIRLDIYNILRDFHNLSEKSNAFIRMGTSDDNDKKVTTFSDNIVISYSEDSSFIEAIYDVGRLQVECLKRGFFIRGGLTIGEIIHTKEVVFGQALVDAYYLENEIAIYPRIIFTEETLLKGIDSRRFRYLNSRLDDKKDIKIFTKQDIDSLYYIDFLDSIFLEQDDLDDQRYINGLKKLVNNENEKLKPKQKMDWFKNKLKLKNI